MSELKWVFQLRQHTPMIHFQSGDTGVCLRATEVKPKFDKFLLTKGNLSEVQKKQWFCQSDSGELSSKIKMRFRAISDALIASKINPLYFGNTGVDTEEKKKTIFLKDGVEGTIICFNPEFLKIIKKYIPIFFLLNNFGTRQNKGFGSFSVTGEGEIRNIFDVIRIYEPNSYYLDYQKLGRTSCNKKLEDIGILYGLMKGGINTTEHYYKSALFRYYIANGIIHEKKAIKTVLFDGGNLQALNAPHYVRAVLGLTDQYRYSDNERRGIVSVKNDNIGRYQSPLYFKVLERYILIYLRPMPEAMKNAAFTFSLSRNNHTESISLKVPEFDIENFMEWFRNDFKNKEKIFDRNGNTIRDSLKAEDNSSFERIEFLVLRRCKK